MAEELKLMCVLAHPDDESLGAGGMLARYADEGVATYLVTATRGERGWTGAEQENPGLEALGRIRTAELMAAARVLGLRQVEFLGYLDGEVDRAEPAEAIARIVDHIRRVRPHVLVTFDPTGAYGHPDHIAVSQFTLSAVVAAASSQSRGSQAFAPHLISKVYFMVDTVPLVEAYESLVGSLTFQVDGVERRFTGWPDWAPTTRLDTARYWETALKAMLCHQSQVGWMADKLAGFPQAFDASIWGVQTFYRASSLVNGGPEIESDLFAGLR